MSICIWLMQTCLASHFGPSWALASTLPVHSLFTFRPWCPLACIPSLLPTWHGGPFWLANWSFPVFFATQLVQQWNIVERQRKLHNCLLIHLHSVVLFLFCVVHLVKCHFLFCGKLCIVCRLKGFVESLHHHVCLKLHLPHWATVPLLPVEFGGASNWSNLRLWFSKRHLQTFLFWLASFNNHVQANLLSLTSPLKVTGWPLYF